jgi:hypothetical protein
MSHETVHDRRKHLRSYVAATARVSFGRTENQAYLVRDLSAQGALLVDGPPLEPGTECKIELDVPSIGVVHIRALTVRRVTDPKDDPAVGVRFLGLAPEIEEGLEELVLQELRRASSPSVLVVDGNFQNLALLAEGLATLGERPLLASTPLEAVHWLCDSQTVVEIALIGKVLRRGSALDLLRLLRDEFGTVRQFLLEEPPELEDLRELLDMAQSARDISGDYARFRRPSIGVA